ncbi:MAG: T9SS type A sorting domain-containing protein [candidate division Zixibacteria bacterium]|nr:T9SS type A sorting domain-containing protein [candidate division Zixibacteria bacterium]
MVRRISGNIFVLLWVVAGRESSAAAGIYTVEFNTAVQWEERQGGICDCVSLKGLDTDMPGAIGSPALPWRSITIAEAWPESAQPIFEILAADTLILPKSIEPGQPDIITSDTASEPASVPGDTSIYGHDLWFPAQNVRSQNSGEFAGQAITALAWCPFRYDPIRNELVVIRRALIRAYEASDCSPDTAASDAEPVFDVPAQSTKRQQENATGGISRQMAGALAGPAWTWPGDTPMGISYVVVTTEAFAATVRPLVEWKARRGVAAGLATVESITAQYPAVDAAASIREYLKDAYAQGLEWVVLAGDETVVPIRYAYAGLTPYSGDPYELQICDLYYGELDGNWDADGDGVWGEQVGDQAQLYPELYVGRLPFANVADARAIIAKIIAYERGPDDAAYLVRSLGVVADQMRDWSDGQGQHALVAASMPSSWSNDLSTMAEAPTGDDPAPVGPAGETLTSLLANGEGWVNYFVHGRADGFVVRSSGLLQWPRAYVFTGGTAGDGNGHLNLTVPTPRPGIHLSAACDQGGFDMDTPPFSAGLGKSVAEQLLFIPQGGAVAFVGQSRWGWVSISYKLVQKFYDYLRDPTIANHVGVYQTLAKVAFPSYRDLVYGNNLYGDPEMPAWKAAPRSLDVAAPTTFTPGPSHWAIEAYNESGAVAAATVTLAAADSVWTMGQTDAAGRLIVDVSFPDVADVILTAYKSDYRIWVDTIPVSIIADVKNHETLKPVAFDLEPNYPNPFNSATVLRFSLPIPAHTNLSVYDILGRSVRTLIESDLDEGAHERTFDAVDDQGRSLASGVYFVRLAAGTRAMTRKIVLIR